MMSYPKDLYNDICDFITSPSNDHNSRFEELAIRSFAYQYQNVEIYGKFCDELGRSPKTVQNIQEIPHLPIEFFKTKQIHTKAKTVQKKFESSGTSDSIRSSHYVCDLPLYELSLTKTFNQFFGDSIKFCMLALLPSYEERNNASLLYMVDHLMQQNEHFETGFYGNDIAGLRSKLLELKKKDIPVILWGVTFAILELLEDWHISLSNTTIIETGGMKGRGQEITRKALHDIIKNRLNPRSICSEYGMTELLSQCYAIDSEIFNHPPWMNVSIRDVQDPLCTLADAKTGGINIIDLANMYSCCFIATQDLGRKIGNGFEVLGRFDNSDIRGCNLIFNA